MALASRIAGIALFVAVSFAARPALAQCGAKRSTCSACHDGSHATAPSTRPWHENHAFADLCTSCHGGRGDAKEASAAHAGVSDPLANRDATCGSCHAASTSDFAARYESLRSIDADAGAAPNAATTTTTPTPASTSSSPPTSHGDARANFMLAAIVFAVAVAFAAWSRGKIRALATRSWSPYAAGVGLGVVVTISMALFGHRLSGAGAYQQLSGFVARPIAPRSMYWQHVVPTGFTWDVVVLLGSIAGAFTAAILAKQFAWRSMPDRQWRDVFGSSVALRFAIAFFGCMLTEIGAGIAGGCTASLAVSGGAVFAPGAFAFVGGMFAGGIPTALLVYRRKRT